MGCFSSKDKHIDEGATFTKSSLLNDAATSQDRADPSLLHGHDSSEDYALPKKQKSEVMKAASAFDALDARSRAAPALEHVHDVAVGERNLALLAAFEKKEADARAAPILQNVSSSDVNVRGSKIFGKLQEYEAKDAKVRAEPKLEKPFSQKTPSYPQPPTRSFIAPVQ